MPEKIDIYINVNRMDVSEIASNFRDASKKNTSLWQYEESLGALYVNSIVSRVSKDAITGSVSMKGELVYKKN